LVSTTGETYWFDNYAEPAEPDRVEIDRIPVDAWRRRLVGVHAGDHEPIGEILRTTDVPIGRIPIYDMPSLPAWHQGPVCLIGDAAHATSPHAGQGASLAMEDAIEVARCLRDVPSVEMAFTAFEALRKERVDRLVREARRSGNQKAMPNVFARWLRDLVLPFFLKKGLRDAEQVFAHRVVWEERVA
jgi:2-polyprenyl-6-methoxyphenol hydroxylase-like FAD-dependent oxidoreductase